MVDEKDKDNENLDINEGAFVKSDDKQNVPSSGVGDGVRYEDRLPGGGSDNEPETSILTGDEAEGFDHRIGDEPGS